MRTSDELRITLETAPDGTRCAQCGDPELVLLVRPATDEAAKIRMAVIMHAETTTIDDLARGEDPLCVPCLVKIALRTGVVIGRRDS